MERSPPCRIQMLCRSGHISTPHLFLVLILFSEIYRTPTQRFCFITTLSRGVNLFYRMVCIWYWSHFTLPAVKPSMNRFLRHNVFFLNSILLFFCFCGRAGLQSRQENVSPKNRQSAAPFQEIRGWSAWGTKSIHPLRERIDQALIWT